MPVRKISSHGGRNIVGRFPSLKMKRMIAFESTIERDYLYLLDYEADVTHFEEQPLVIEYQHTSKKLRYTPDFHIIRSGQNILAECKPQAKVNDEDNQRKFAAGRKFCMEHEWEFMVITDQALRSSSRLTNVKLLRRYASHHATMPETKAWIYALLQDAPTPPTVGQIQAAAPPLPAIAFATLLHMAYHHELAIPMDDGLISASSPIYLPGGQP